MTTKPLITIITATYNAATCLESSAQSVFGQTYPHYEYIIIDGGSSDETTEIIKRYQTRLKYWVSEADSGIYDAWNKGLRYSQGEWILFLGADDQLLPDALEKYINFIKSHPKDTFDYISSKVQRVNPNGTIEGIVGKPWIWSEFKYRMTTAHPGSFHSRKLFDMYGTYSTRYKIVSDYEILLRAREKLRAGFIDQVTVLMSTGGKFNAIEATRECLRMFKDSGHLSYLSFYSHSLNIYFRRLAKSLLHYLK